jgi:hypothetical protein
MLPRHARLAQPGRLGRENQQERQAGREAEGQHESQSLVGEKTGDQFFQPGFFRFGV